MADPFAKPVLADLQRRDTVSRIWRKDYTLWKPDPTEIVDRLGWLEAPTVMGQQVPALEHFANQVHQEGSKHVVLLGMGSILGPMILGQAFGNVQGYPELIVLDSTVPASVEAVVQTINPRQTLFLVASKSGTTIETLSLYNYFRGLVEGSLGKERAGGSFVAITDAATPLERLAKERGFRHLFLNPLDVGGRYSVLSYFGLVPAALIGIDLTTLLHRAARMSEACAHEVPLQENPGAHLGGTVGALAQEGRDKLTLLASASISSLALWVEQLLAESTGKEGKGIVPVTGEPLMDPTHYGQDRAFVHLRLKSDPDTRTDAALAAIQAAGHPVMTLELNDPYDLAAEFFRWEFATAVLGAILGIHPFNQPGVQRAKNETDHVLQQYQATGQLPRVEVVGSLKDLLVEAKPGRYLAIMAYLHATPQVEAALAHLRRRVARRFGIATAMGYGPRVLHSVGQLHKEGPDNGLYLQITAADQRGVPVPGQGYTFGTLVEAQALGDLRALQALGRRVIQVQVGQEPAEEIMRLANMVD